MAQTILKQTKPQFIKETYAQTKTFPRDTDVQFNIEVTKEGWTPLAYSIRYSYASQMIVGVESYRFIESLSKAIFAGFARNYLGQGTFEATIYADVLWVKNGDAIITDNGTITVSS